MCGIFAAFRCPKAAEITYLALHAMQHRAQEYAGIATSDGSNIFRITGQGIVQDVFDQKTLDQLHGKCALGHIRYSTREDNPKLDNTQPLTGFFTDGEVAIVHNGNLFNIQGIQKQLEQESGPFKTSIDTEVILRLFCRSKEKNIFKRVFESIRGLRGTYSLLFLFKDTLIAVRDPWGNRPLSLGKKDHSWFVASETVVFDNLSIETVREIQPGEILVITKNGQRSQYFDTNRLSQKLIPHQHAYCIFELLYFSHPASVMFDGESVANFRLRAGRKLCQSCPSPGKTIVAVPDSAMFHGEGYAEADPKATLAQGLLRSHYIGRTFIEGLQELRVSGVAKKFTALRVLLKDKIVTLVDDSIVRLNTMPDVIALIHHAGAKQVHVRITTPPIKYPCRYGIDMPTKKELTAANHTVEEIRKIAGGKIAGADTLEDTLEYMSLEALQSLVAKPDDFCYACMTGNYPI